MGDGKGGEGGCGEEGVIDERVWKGDRIGDQRLNLGVARRVYCVVMES